MTDKFERTREMIIKSFESMKEHCEASLKEFPDNEYIQGMNKGVINGMEFIISCLNEYGKLYDYIHGENQDESEK